MVEIPRTWRNNPLAATREVLAARLAEAAAVPVVAADAASALTMLDAQAALGQPFTALLLDGRLPEGARLAAALDALPGYAALPRVLLARLAREDGASRLGSAQYGALLIEPVRTEILAKTLDRLLTGAVERAPAPRDRPGEQRPPS